MSRRRWLIFVAGIFVLLFAGRMVLRYLDWQTSDAARSAPAEPIPRPAVRR